MDKMASLLLLLRRTEKNRIWRNLFLLTIVILLSNCQNHKLPVPTITPIKSSLTPTASSTITLTPTNLPTKIPSLIPTLTPQPEPTFQQPEGCLEPSKDYTLVYINGMVINQRTYDMLVQAQELYGGEIDLTGYHLTQGSYTNEVSASFGTHSGGGAVDLSVIQYGTYQVLYDDIEPLVHALRTAGFAAWLRGFDELYPGSPIHIHAIAIGDRDLSSAAYEQLNGVFGYFRGFNGLPQPGGVAPIPDEYGGPILCKWMIEQGYTDLREAIP
ncbi:MAG: hypothetical protein ACYDH1_09730 [Anaerolineaceae bacterium]